MYKNTTAVVLIFLSLLISAGKSYGYLMQATLPLADIVKTSRLIVVGEITKCPADYAIYVPNADGLNTRPSETFSGFPDTIKPSGRYEIRVRSVIKGKSERSLALPLPALLGLYYGFTKLKIQNGDRVLLLLTKDAHGRLVPTDPTLPLIQLGASGEQPLGPALHGDPLISSASLMLGSLSEPSRRQANTYLLRDVAAPNVKAAMAKFVNDPNLYVRDSALSSLAANQVVSAIPLILRLQREQAKRGLGTNGVQALQYYTDPAAVPALNPLLFDSDVNVRTNTTMALQKIASVRSIPYLILALRDPDPQHLAPSLAYLTLRKVALKLPEPGDDFDAFKPLPQKDLAPVNSWWRKRLNGKYVSGRPIRQPTGTLESQNQALFDPRTSVRLKAVKHLTGTANKTSIPYLILGLQDPDTRVAYGTYKLLWHLLPGLGSVKEAHAFQANRAMVIRPAYDWWRDELLGKH